MRILFLLFVYLLLLAAEGTVSVPAPENTRVSSHNFIHILKWKPGPGTRPGTVYNVNVLNHQVRNITATSTNLSKYMSEKFQTYDIWLWASFGNSSSSVVKSVFSPYTNTVIGPPNLSLSGCGNCLNISIDLPNRDASCSFYNAIRFDIHWKKASDEEDGCQNPFTKFQSTNYVPYQYVLLNLEPGERYCVQATPKVNSLPEQNRALGSCACEFTSQLKTTGVIFPIGWVASSVVVGLCFLTCVFVYTGCMFKPIRLPKALIVVVHAVVLVPEETCVSVLEIQNTEDQQHNNNNKKKQNTDNDDDDDDEESRHDYMDRAAPSESESICSGSSANIRKAEENPEGCGFNDAFAHTADTLLLSQVRHHGGEGYSLEPSLEPIQRNVNVFSTEEKKTYSVGVKREDVVEEDSGNVNLWSVVLKSLQPEEDEEEEEDATAPLLLKEFPAKAVKPQRGSSEECHTALLFHAQTGTQSSQDVERDVSDTSVCDHMRTGYMASHTGTIGPEHCSSEDEDEDCASGYMVR